MKFRLYFAALAVIVAVSNPLRGESPSESVPDFSADVRPILSDHCFACHGPDEHDRHADLRLDTADGIAAVIDVDDLDESAILLRVHASDADELMPPKDFNKPLSDSQKQILKRWVKSGGAFQQHWAFEPVDQIELPAGAADPIDYFIDAAIQAKGLTANESASDTTLLRRVCLDLTGLPPTREQIRRVQEGELDYEKLVDELLASPAFGQHQGRYWLDLVRYADTHGLHLDNYREMWPYRDWVIDAINRNMPFDQFLVEQLAGDLIPDATRAQKIASGFNRLNVTTSEGGSIYEEVFARNVIDRTDAFGTIFMGLTTQCAVCHDHKFDPISQKEYYSLFAFFNSLDGRALDENRKDPAPVISVPDSEQVQQLASFDQQIATLNEEMKQPIESVDEAQRAWEESLVADQSKPSGDNTQVLAPESAHSAADAEYVIEADNSVRSADKVANKDTLTVQAPLPQSLAGGTWQTLELDVLADPKTDRAGVSPNGNAVLTEITIETRTSPDTADSESTSKWQPLAITLALADIEQSNGDFAVSFAIDQQRDGSSGWAIAGHEQTGGRKAWFQVPELAQRIEHGDDQIRVRLEFQSVYAKHQFYAMRFRLTEAPPMIPTKDQIAVSEIHSVGPFPVESSNAGYSRSFASQEADFKADETFTYEDQSYPWQSRGDWTPVDVHELPLVGESAVVNLLHQTLKSPKKQTVDLLLGTSDGHVVFLNKKRVAQSKVVGPLQPLSQTYKLELKKGDNDLYIKAVSQSRPAHFTYAFRSPAIALPETIVQLAGRAVAERSDAQSASLRAYYRQVVCAHPDWQALQDMVRGAEAAKQKLEAEIPTTLVWKEVQPPREAKVLIRGQYDQPGETVPRDVPAFLPPIPEGLPHDRMGLAKWLTAPDHPLTARVAVNRFWQSILGVGLVKSSEDFGSQGEPPSHPKLLDWLAEDFRTNGWNVKRLIKQMVTSEAYRRDPLVRTHDLQLDPGNRFLARGPRHRLDAEVLRDQALALAGLLNERSGGPSVKPPQPAGLWYAVGYTRSNTANFKADPEPEKQLRRSVYIFWKRTSAPPQMSTFDAPSRESCTARRERTNTPLQALLLMNETQYLESAKHLAIRALVECELDEPADKIAWLFETVTARRPTETEVAELVSLHKILLNHYTDQPQAAAQLLAVDDNQPEQISPVQHAAWMMIASTLLNLDELVNN
ncbi:PSD1 and planctomycete cytochrome C domain-containing protein [Stieleria sp. TO1_6]|uniref:PSD1 and planctomycete cytochrome C domain-containing protein n=1 Tax=Stieleria tagensis TaxID=2956795 RepID=UPI00209AF06B|nr:PSD1 and planctomycete cytochrome C domain-containing protein [Stieleria tagensis]MCO8120372.1 PSD1 and planctomycete cytochrome C domain-containing protein [Stieleria tagensis]